MKAIHWLRYKGREPGERIVPSLCSPATVEWRVAYMKAKYGVTAVEDIELDHMSLDSGGMVVLSDPFIEVYVGEWLATCRLLHVGPVLNAIRDRRVAVSDGVVISKFGGPNRIHCLLEEEATALYAGLLAAEEKISTNPNAEEPAPSLLAAFLPLEEAES